MAQTFKRPPSGLDRTQFVTLHGRVYEHSPWIAEAAWSAGLTPQHDTVEGLHRGAGRDRGCGAARAAIGAAERASGSGGTPGGARRIDRGIDLGAGQRRARQMQPGRVPALHRTERRLPAQVSASPSSWRSRARAGPRSWTPSSGAFTMTRTSSSGPPSPKCIELRFCACGSCDGAHAAAGSRPCPGYARLKEPVAALEGSCGVASFGLVAFHRLVLGRAGVGPVDRAQFGGEANSRPRRSPCRRISRGNSIAASTRRISARASPISWRRRRRGNPDNQALLLTLDPQQVELDRPLRTAERADRARRAGRAG